MWTFQVLDIKFLKKKISVCGNLVVGDELLNPVKKSFKNKKWNVKRWKTIWQQKPKLGNSNLRPTLLKETKK